MEPLDIRASLQLTATEGEGRKIVAEIVRYGAVGNTSFGATIFEPGSIKIHADMSRVKLLEMHDQERSLGYLVDFEDSQDRLNGTFEVANTPQGNNALAGVRNKTRDAVSLGVTVEDYEFTDSGELVVKSSVLNETSLVTIPAFSESRVQKIAAARQEKNTMDLEDKSTTPAQQPQQPQETAPVNVEAAQQPQQLAPVAHAPQVVEASAEKSMSLSVLASKISEAGSLGGVTAVNQVLAKSMPSLFVTAALTDVVPADDAGLTTSVTRPQWFGEMWKARRVGRPTIDSVGVEPLTSMKGYGYSLVYPTTPNLVNDYAGAKAAVPASGKVTTQPEEWAAKRKAGGWDVDRAYFDFNDQAFIEITLRAAYDDYLKQTEAELVAAMLAAGVATEGADILELLAKVGGDAAALGSAISKIQFAPDLWAQFVGLTSAEAPWWLRNQGSINLGTTEGNAGNLAFNVNPELPAGQMMAHDRRAVTYRETPLVQVRAENIPQGGIDLGVFGYMSHTINDSRAIFKGSIAAAPVG